MKDKQILLLIPMVLLLVIVLSVILYDNYETTRTNDKLKKEKFECKQELKKSQDEMLKKIIKGE